MGMPKYAAKTDKNQREIVAALKAIGCDVYEIRKPVDLLVGYRGVNKLLEVKRPTMTRRKDQQHQRDFIRAWRGDAVMVTSPEEAIAAVTRRD